MLHCSFVWCPVVVAKQLHRFCWLIISSSVANFIQHMANWPVVPPR